MFSKSTLTIHSKPECLNLINFLVRGPEFSSMIMLAIEFEVHISEDTFQGWEIVTLTMPARNVFNVNDRQGTISAFLVFHGLCILDAQVS